MYTIQVTSDGDYDLLQAPTKREGVSIVVEDRASATTTIGYMKKDGDFQAYADGALTDADTHCLCGTGVRLMVRVAGVSGTLIISTAGYGQ